MQAEQDPPPPWLASFRDIVYFAGQYWWAIVATVVVLAKLLGLPWTSAALLGLAVLAVLVAGPIVLGVVIALVSRARNRQADE